MRFSKLIVATVIALNVAFAAVVLWIFYRTGLEPTTLIVAWFGFTCGELGLLALIKRTEVKNHADRGD